MNVPQYWCRGRGSVHSPTDCTDGIARVLGGSSHARALRDQITRVAHRGNTVLISGETGTGKEVVARAIHCAAWRDDASASLVVLGCSTLPEGCLHSVLQIKGGNACPNCRAAQLGGGGNPAGTLLLDEISELSLSGQEALLAFLNNDCRDSSRSGSMLVVATTNQDLHNKVAQGSFRSDLYHRLAACEIPVPPLRERVEDVPTLLNYLIEDANHAFGTEVRGITPSALETALAYPWPGNVRELKNVVLQAVLLTRNGSLEDLSLDTPAVALRNTLRTLIRRHLELHDRRSAKGLMRDFEDELLRALVDVCEGDESLIGEALGVAPEALGEILRRHASHENGAH